MHKIEEAWLLVAGHRVSLPGQNELQILGELHTSKCIGLTEDK